MLERTYSRLRNTMPTGLTATALTAFVLVAATGCGSSDDSGLSKADLVKQADPICKRHAKTITAAANKVIAGGKLPKPREFGALANKVIIPQIDAQVKELRALDPADDVSGDYKKWLDDTEALLGKLKQNPMLITNPANFAKVNQQADALGLARECHAGPS